MSMVQKMKKLRHDLSSTTGVDCFLFRKADWIQAQKEVHMNINTAPSDLMKICGIKPIPLRLDSNRFYGLPVFLYETDEERVAMLLELAKKYKTIGVLT